MNAALYPKTMADHGPPRSLAQVRHELIARRLDLIRQQIDAKNLVTALGAEIAAVEVRLRAINEATA